MLYSGDGVERDYAQAIRWYTQSAMKGNAGAQCNLGCCYQHGAGVTQDYVQAVRWLTKAAEQNNADAQANLGWCYYNVMELQNYAQAVMWYRQSAEQNNAYAQTGLGWCYYNGHGVTQDYVQAVRWFTKAAEQGNVTAQCNLGWCYYKGYGVKQDYVQAAKWYEKAAKQGNADAQRMLNECSMANKNNYTSMSKDEIITDALNELKPIERAYQSNPNNIELAISYSKQLVIITDLIVIGRQERDKSMVLQSVLNSLTAVYQKHPNNEEIALKYLHGICWTPQYVENAVEKMIEAVRRFSYSEQVKVSCANGLYRLVLVYADRKDIANAENTIEYLRKLHIDNPRAEWVAAHYANALSAVYSMYSSNGKCSIADKLKKLAEQYPRNQTIADSYRFVKNPRGYFG